MKRKNFPGRKKSRREHALANLQNALVEAADLSNNQNKVYDLSRAIKNTEDKL